MKRRTDDEHRQRERTETSEQEAPENAETLERDIIGQHVVELFRLESVGMKLRNQAHSARRFTVGDGAMKKA